MLVVYAYLIDTHVINKYPYPHFTVGNYSCKTLALKIKGLVYPLKSTSTLD